MEGKPQRREVLDLVDESVDVVVRTESDVAAGRDCLREIGEAKAELEHPGVVLRC